MSDKPRVTSTEIRFFVRVASSTATKDLQEILARIARIIDWTGQFTEKDSGYKYMIGTSNDWWMDIEERIQWGRIKIDDTTFVVAEIVVAHRYGNFKFMEGLRNTFLRLLSVEYFQAS